MAVDESIWGMLWIAIMIMFHALADYPSFNWILSPHLTHFIHAFLEDLWPTPCEVG